MKHYYSKRITMVLFILLAGTLLSGCGFRYIVNSANSLSRADAEEFNVNKEVVEPITKIDIHTGMAEVELIPADDFYVEIDYLYWEEAPDYSIENGVLHFDDSDSFPNSYSISFNLDNSIKIYLPAAAALSDLYVENSSGDVTIAGFVAEDLDVTVSYGDFTLKDVAATKADITLSSGASRISDFRVGILDFTNSYGNAKFTNINIGDANLPKDVSFDTFDVTMSSGNVDITGLNMNSIKINNSYGNITCKEITATEFDMELSSGNLDVSKSDLAQVDVNNSYGNVNLELFGSETDYTFDLSTSYGNIKVGDKSYEDHLQIDKNGSRKITADLSSGDVVLNFKN